MNGKCFFPFIQQRTGHVCDARQINMFFFGFILGLNFTKCTYIFFFGVYLLFQYLSVSFESSIFYWWNFSYLTEQWTFSFFYVLCKTSLTFCFCSTFYFFALLSCVFNNNNNNNRSVCNEMSHVYFRQLLRWRCHYH